MMKPPEDGTQLVCIDAIAELAQCAPPGYRLLLSKAPPTAPFTIPDATASHVQDGPGFAFGNRLTCKKADNGKRKPLSRSVQEERLANEVTEAVKDAAQRLQKASADVDQNKRERDAFAIAQSPPSGTVDWIRLLEDSRQRQEALHGMRKAWEKRTGHAIEPEEPAPAHEATEGPIKVEADRPLCCQPEKILSRLVKNQAEHAAWLDLRRDNDEHASTKLFLPPRSAFLVTDILRPTLSSQANVPAGWSQVLKHAALYPPDLLLLDPPYPNKSAKRLKRSRETYSITHDIYDLWRLVDPVRRLIAMARDKKSPRSGGTPLVACWVTNDPKVQRFILTKLFPAWGLEHVGQLVWLKTVRDCSEPVFALENAQGRKPYEILLLARPAPVQRLTQPDAATGPIRTRVLACTTSGHSRKPSILEHVEPWLPRRKIGTVDRDLNVYELFARTVPPGPGRAGHWTSIGNEPCLFNQVGVGFIDEQGKEW